MNDLYVYIAHKLTSVGGYGNDADMYNGSISFYFIFYVSFNKKKIYLLILIKYAKHRQHKY